MPEPIEVRKVPLQHVSDASELGRLIRDGVLEADRVIAVIGKTEGNGGVNGSTTTPGSGLTARSGRC
jgi:barbiturase